MKPPRICRYLYLLYTATHYVFGAASENSKHAAGPHRNAGLSRVTETGTVHSNKTIKTGMTVVLVTSKVKLAGTDAKVTPIIKINGHKQTLTSINDEVKGDELEQGDIDIVNYEVEVPEQFCQSSHIPGFIMFGVIFDPTNRLFNLGSGWNLKALAVYFDECHKNLFVFKEVFGKPDEKKGKWITDSASTEHLFDLKRHYKIINYKTLAIAATTVADFDLVKILYI